MTQQYLIAVNGRLGLALGMPSGKELAEPNNKKLCGRVFKFDWFS
jgi:hypothetical protein